MRTILEFSLVFFFQAEDGIRDTSVTGVQTCALPILVANPHGLHMRPAMMFARLASRFKSSVTIWKKDRSANGKSMVRSEERRVGKESRCRKTTYRKKKKQEPERERKASANRKERMSK